MINLPRGCADSHGYCISLNVSPPTGPQIQNGFGKQHGNESTKMDWFEFTNAVCFLFNRQQSLLGCESLSTHFLKEVYFGSLKMGSNPCIPVCTSDFSLDGRRQQKPLDYSA